MPESAKRNVILTAATGYEFAVLKPFLVSLRKAGFTGRTCFFVGDLSAETRLLMQKLGAELYNFAFREVDDNLTMTSARFYLFYRFLLDNREAIDKVLLCDARDVVFQRDPFDFDMGNAVCCFQEDKGTSIRQSPINASWVRQAFGEQVLGELGHNPVSCVGTVYAPCGLMIEYLEVLTRLLVDIRPDFFSSDQAAHIYMVYKGLVPSMRLYDNDHGPVLTLGTKPIESIKVNRLEEVVNDDLAVVPVLHQYDRHPVLQALLLKRFG